MEVGHSFGITAGNFLDSYPFGPLTRTFDDYIA
jgi:hypothetical protein